MEFEASQSGVVEVSWSFRLGPQALNPKPETALKFEIRKLQTPTPKPRPCKMLQGDDFKVAEHTTMALMFRPSFPGLGKEKLEKRQALNP